MKNLKLSAILLSGMLLLGISSFAQQGHNNAGEGKGCQMDATKCMGIPNLTDEQKTKIDALKLTHQKEMLTLKNQMGELKAKERTLATADQADMKAINANIDEITKVQNQLMKKKAQHQQEVRSLLNAEQKLWFDTHAGKGKHDGKNMGMSKGNDDIKGQHHCGARDSSNCKMKMPVQQ